MFLYLFFLPFLIALTQFYLFIINNHLIYISLFLPTFYGLLQMLKILLLCQALSFCNLFNILNFQSLIRNKLVGNAYSFPV